MVCADAGYTGVEKREEHAGRHVIWRIASRRSTYKKHGKCSALYKAMRKIEKAKAQVRAKVEHPFRVIKRQSGYTNSALPRLGEEHCSDGDAVGPVKRVDGASIFALQRRRGASLMREIAAARRVQQQKCME